ncbi:hypothetical protein [Nocardiopsis coralliicola]
MDSVEQQPDQVSLDKMLGPVALALILIAELVGVGTLALFSFADWVHYEDVCRPEERFTTECQEQLRDLRILQGFAVAAAVGTAVHWAVLLVRAGRR